MVEPDAERAVHLLVGVEGTDPTAPRVRQCRAVGLPEVEKLLEGKRDEVVIGVEDQATARPSIAVPMTPILSSLSIVVNRERPLSLFTQPPILHPHLKLIRQKSSLRDRHHALSARYLRKARCLVLVVS